MRPQSLELRLASRLLLLRRLQPLFLSQLRAAAPFPINENQDKPSTHSSENIHF
jgi:hypothetical protein